MKSLNKYVVAISFLAVMVISIPGRVLAATTPVLGAASSFTILSSSYINTTAGTTINGDLGYTTGPATAPTVNGNTHIADSKYNRAGIAQNAALADLNSQACTFDFSPGNINLATDTTHGPVGQYGPGVYCIDGQASIGTAGINLIGSGTYIFRMDGALTTAANSVVTFSGGASPCDVFWTPTAATTLGANSTFGGIDIDPSGISIGSTVTWNGRALAFGGTVTTDVDTISSAGCVTEFDEGDDDTAASSRSGTGSNTTPRLPNSGYEPQSNNVSWGFIAPVAVVVTTGSLYLLRKRRA